MEPPRAPGLDSINQYTIGWICALPIERAAARAALDVEHEDPRDFVQPHGDDNSYVWGSVDKHNVVVASLPDGVYGTASAVDTARDMIRTCPNVRIGLMVGIGAGVPHPEKDIRLGDVVVSKPHGTSGGVVQYDLGKVVENIMSALGGSGFKRVGILNSPPKVLLNSLAAIQAAHKLGLHKMAHSLTHMFTRFPGMAQPQQDAPAFVHQGVESDRLYPASIPHAGGPDCSRCDPIQQVYRQPRSTMTPYIHYGVIASGSTLVKNATARDLLVRQTGEECICFEMEAAGLMNSFPCLVIRGICDYADSHKNDKWQPFAAATAAAYARELLGHVPAREITSTPTVRDVIKAESAASSDAASSESGNGASTPNVASWTSIPSTNQSSSSSSAPWATPPSSSSHAPWASPPPPSSHAPWASPPPPSSHAPWASPPPPSSHAPWAGPPPSSSPAPWAGPPPSSSPAPWAGQQQQSYTSASWASPPPSCGPGSPAPWASQPSPYGTAPWASQPSPHGTAPWASQQQFPHPTDATIQRLSSDLAASTDLVNSLTNLVTSLAGQVNSLADQVNSLNGNVAKLEAANAGGPRSGGAGTSLSERQLCQLTLETVPDGVCFYQGNGALTLWFPGGKMFPIHDDAGIIPAPVPALGGYPVQINHKVVGELRVPHAPSTPEWKIVVRSPRPGVISE